MTTMQHPAQIIGLIAAEYSSDHQKYAAWPALLKQLAENAGLDFPGEVKPGYSAWAANWLIEKKAVTGEELCAMIALIDT
jgi:hypothetical protein